MARKVQDRMFAPRKESNRSIAARGFREGIIYYQEYVDTLDCDQDNRLMIQVIKMISLEESEWQRFMYGQPVARIVSKMLLGHRASDFWEWYDDVPSYGKRAFLHGFLMGLDEAACKHVCFGDTF